MTVLARIIQFLVTVQANVIASQRVPKAYVSSDMSSIDAMNHSTSKHQAFLIIWDTGASYTITPDKEDFLSYSGNPSVTAMQGFGKENKETVKGEGTIIWYVEDENGNLQALKMKAFHIPTSPHQLLSTHALGSQHPEFTMAVTMKGARVTGIPYVAPIYAPINKRSNLIVSMAHRYGGSSISFSDVSNVPGAYPATPSIVSNDNLNLSAAEKELLRCHQRFGHISFAKVQHLLCTGILANSESARRLHQSAASVPVPKCPECVFAKQRHCPAPGTTSTVVQDKVCAIRRNNLAPAQEISVDHFICSQKGCLFTSRGKESANDMYFCSLCLQLHS